MKLWMKLAGTGTLCVAAVCCAAAAIGGITGGAEAEAEPPGQLVWPGDAADAEFVLREYDGCVAVFAAGESRPLTTTDISVRTLREADRALLNAGLPCSDRGEVLSLLEDLGS